MFNKITIILFILNIINSNPLYCVKLYDNTVSDIITLVHDYNVNNKFDNDKIKNLIDTINKILIKCNHIDIKYVKLNFCVEQIILFYPEIIKIVENLKKKDNIDKYAELIPFMIKSQRIVNKCINYKNII